MVGLELSNGEEIHAHPDPVVLELNKLQNQLKEKDRELGEAHSEIKALKASEVLKDKALEELGNGRKRLEEKLRLNENILEQKNLDIKRLTNEKKEALTAQYAAEATLRRVYSEQKDDDSVPIESVIAPLEAEIKMYKSEISALQEDKRSLERLTRSKEAALLEAERILRSALERALIVEEVQNQNFELRRQIEICQEENKILDKTNRQKVLEVEKLSETIKELEEAILAGGAAANTIRDFQRQISELREERRTLERELARIKVSANRVATVVANEWKDENDKVMPVKQWLEERRLLQAEMQRLKDKLAISERTAKAEEQLKEKLKLRLKTLEDGLKRSSGVPIRTNAYCESPKPEKINNFFGILSSNSTKKKRSTSQPRSCTISKNSELPTEKYASGETLLRKSLWTSSNKVTDSSGKEFSEVKENNSDNLKENMITGSVDTKEISNQEINGTAISRNDNNDMVSGFLYDRLQKEVINLRKICEAKDATLNAKDEETKMLMKKVETLTKAIEVESKKFKREAAGREKELISTKLEEKITRNTNISRRAVKAS